MKKNSRNKSIDIAKGIGIILMIVGHFGSTCPNYLHAWIYSFHMPLFFFCSGIFAKSFGELSSLYNNLTRRVSSLLIPYFSYVVIFVIFDYVISFQSYPLHILLDVIYGYDPFNFLWFLYTLFFISVLFSLLSYVLKDNDTIITITISFFSCLAYYLHTTNQLERVGSILFGLCFYYLGHRYKKIINKKSKVILTGSILISVLGTLGLTLVSGDSRKSIDLHHNYYPDVLFTIIIALSGILIIMIISQKLSDINIICKICSLIGKESLIIYPIFTYLPLRLKYILGDQLGICKLINVLIAVILCTIIIYVKRLLYNRKL